MLELEKPYGVRDFGLHAIIPTRPCPIHPKQIRMGDVAHIIWILFIIRSSPCPGRDVAILLPRNEEQLPTDGDIIACCMSSVYHRKGINSKRHFYIELLSVPPLWLRKSYDSICRVLLVS